MDQPSTISMTTIPEPVQEIKDSSFIEPYPQPIHLDPTHTDYHILYEEMNKQDDQMALHALLQKLVDPVYRNNQVL